MPLYPLVAVHRHPEGCEAQEQPGAPSEQAAGSVGSFCHWASESQAPSHPDVSCPLENEVETLTALWACV